MDGSMNFLSKLDQFFTSVVSWLIHKISYVFIALMGCLTIISIPISFLEYNEGFADLDILETSLIALFFIMVWRFVKVSRTVDLSYWSAIKRLFIILTLGFLFTSLIEGIFLIIQLYSQGNLSTAFYEQQDDWMALFDTMLLIVLLYGLVPKTSENAQVQPKQTETTELDSSEVVMTKDDTPSGVNPA